MSGQYPNTFYRVSIKGLCTNAQGKVLVVKEDRDVWDLPGGGLDHGEDAKAALTRELKEELGVACSVGDPLLVKTIFLDKKDAWLLWIVYSIKLHSDSFVLGNGVSEASFIDASGLDQKNLFESLVKQILCEV